MNNTLTWIHARWDANENCLSAPSLIVSLTLPDPKTNRNDFNMANQTFPSVIFVQNIYPYKSCGNLVVPLESNQLCCTSNIDVFTGSSARTSEANINAADNSGEIFIPASANGYSYCKLTPSPAGTVFQYNSIMIRNDGSCNSIRTYNNSKFAELSISCSQSGVLSVFKNNDCSSLFSKYPVPGTLANLTTGLVHTELITYTEGSIVVGWISYYPGGGSIYW